MTPLTSPNPLPPRVLLPRGGTCPRVRAHTGLDTHRHPLSCPPTQPTPAQSCAPSRGPSRRLLEGRKEAVRHPPPRQGDSQGAGGPPRFIPKSQGGCACPTCPSLLLPQLPVGK